MRLRTKVVFATTLTILSSMFVVSNAVADVCSWPGPCGSVENKTNKFIEVSGDPYGFTVVSPNSKLGGYWNDEIDVDFIWVPRDCQLGGGIGGDPIVWNEGKWKIGNDQSLVVNYLACENNGFLEAYVDAYNDHETRSSPDCSWWGSSRRWGSCNFNDQASTLRNGSNNYAVNLYRDVNYGGAWACLSAGDIWPDLSKGIIFSYGRGRSGFGQSVNDQISSHKWVRRCGMP